MFMRPFRIVVLVTSAALMGCSGNGPETATVSGEITVGGKKLEKGTIQFTPENGKGMSAEVVDGRYEVRTSAGHNRIQISAMVVTGKQKESNDPGAAEVEVYGELLPEKYNARSDLAFDVQPGSNTKNWQLDPGKKTR